MSVFTSLVKKEGLHIVRDPRTMVISIIMPVVLLLLFGFAISTEVGDIRIVIVQDRYSEEVGDVIENFKVNESFDFRGVAQHQEVTSLFESDKIDAALYIREQKGNLQFQILADASNPTMAQSVSAYITGVIGNEVKSTPVLISTLYNPQLKSAYNFVPGIMGMIFILICAIMTSVSIVREKETGTLDLLLVSPIRPRTIILGKLVPYFILSCLILILMLSISYTLLGLPLSMSVINVVFITLLYIILSLSLGLLVSTLVNSQLSALIISAIGLMLPVIMLSGMLFPIDNMPVILQGISCIIPARWYISAMRKLMIQQLDLSFVLNEVLILSVMTMFLLVLAIRKFTASRR